MKRRSNKALLAIIFLLITCYSLNAQTVYRISAATANDMKLSGTSTLHKWSMDTKTFTGDAAFAFKAGSPSQLSSITALNFSLEVLNLKSGEKGLDKNAYKALKTTQYKNITYKLVSATVKSATDNNYTVNTHGNLTVAGVTKPIAMDVYIAINIDATITCSGTYKLKMSDYSVKPPSFMMGAMKTGDAVTLDFTLVYIK